MNRHVMTFNQFSLNEEEAKTAPKTTKGAPPKGNPYSLKPMPDSSRIVLPSGSKKVIAGYAAEWGSDSKMFSTDSKGVTQAKEWLYGQMQSNKSKLTGSYKPNIFYFCAVLDEKNPPKPVKKGNSYEMTGKWDQTRPLWIREVEPSVKEKTFDNVIKGQEGLFKIAVMTPAQRRSLSQEEFEDEDR